MTSARVLMTRSKIVPGTARTTGAPSIGRRSAGVSLIRIRGGSFLTAISVGSTLPLAASDASRRSSAMVRWEAAKWVWSARPYAAPRSGSVGKSAFVMVRSSSATMRETRSTRVRAVAQTTPKVSGPPVVTRAATAARSASAFPCHELT